MKVNVDKLKK